MENVLVVETGLLTPYIGGRTGLITENSDVITGIIVREHRFIPRPAAEDDPGFKQIIPYVILRRGEQVFVTRRLKKGGEARLHGKISIGIGGHINPVDEQDRQLVLLRGLERELDEELSMGKHGELVPRGFINDDSNGVGSVHLGMCYTMEVSGEVTVKETEKLSGGWMSVKELEDSFDDMETWTQIAMGILR